MTSVAREAHVRIETIRFLRHTGVEQGQPLTPTALAEIERHRRRLSELRPQLSSADVHLSVAIERELDGAAR